MPRVPRRPMVAVVVVLAAVGIGFLVYAAPQLGAPFGESHDGLNGAVWATGSRYFREAGPLTSALGGRRPDGTHYANHPPAIYAATATAEWVAGEHPWSTRAPAWLASLASIPLLWLILRRLRVGPLAATIGIAVAATTPMLFVYGAMLDTPILAFPVGLAVGLVWLRSWTDDPVSPRVAVPVAILAGLVGWQALFAVGLAAVSLAWRARRGHGSRTVSISLAGGGAIGAGLTAAWVWWVTGSPRGLVDAFASRTGGEGGASWTGMVSNQGEWLTHLLGLALLGLVACLAVAAFDRGPRQAAAIWSLVVVFGYSVLLHSGAFVHQYWNYWVILPVALGAAVGSEHLMQVLRRRGSTPVAASVAVVVLAVVLVGSSRLMPSPDRTMMSDGDVPARLLIAHPLPDDQPTLYYVGGLYGPEVWMSYLTHRPAEPLTERSELAELAREHPDALVLTVNSCVQGDLLCITTARLPVTGAALDVEHDSVGTEYRVYRAAALDDAIGTSA